METFKQTFDNLNPKRRKNQHLIFTFMGLINIALGILIYYKDGKNS